MVIKNLFERMQSILNEGIADDVAKLLGMEQQEAEAAIKKLPFAKYLELANAVDIQDTEAAERALSMAMDDGYVSGAVPDSEYDFDKDTRWGDGETWGDINEGDVVDMSKYRKEPTFLDDLTKGSADTLKHAGELLTPKLDWGKTLKKHMDQAILPVGTKVKILPDSLPPPSRGASQKWLLQGAKGMIVGVADDGHSKPMYMVSVAWRPDPLPFFREDFEVIRKVTEADNPYQKITPPSEKLPSQSIQQNQPAQQSNIGRKDVDDLLPGDEIEVIDVDGEPTATTVKNPRGPGDTLVVQDEHRREHIVKKNNVSGTPKLKESVFSDNDVIYAVRDGEVLKGWVIRPDLEYPGMYRVRFEDGSTSTEYAEHLLKNRLDAARKAFPSDLKNNTSIGESMSVRVCTECGGKGQAKYKENGEMVLDTCRKCDGEGELDGMDDETFGRKGRDDFDEGLDRMKVLAGIPSVALVKENYGTRDGMYNHYPEWLADAQARGYQIEPSGDGKTIAHVDGVEKGYWDPYYGGSGMGYFHPGAEGKSEVLKKAGATDLPLSKVDENFYDWAEGGQKIRSETKNKEQKQKEEKPKQTDDKKEVDEGYFDQPFKRTRTMKTGSIKSKAIGKTVKIFAGEHAGKIGVVVSAYREPTFSAMVPYMTEYGIELDGGEKVYVRKRDVRALKQQPAPAAPVAETASCGATGAGAVASAPAAVGMVSRMGTTKKKKKDFNIGGSIYKETAKPSPKARNTEEKRDGIGRSKKN